MSDDLIERLRSAVGDARLVKLCRDAADALAAVEQERDHWHRVAMQAAEQERDAARVWHEKAHTFLEERNAYRARLAEVEQERDAARARIERLERGLTPRRWTREMNDAWHRSIPDVEQAFAGLRSVLFPDQEGDGRDPVVVEAREYFAALREMNAATPTPAPDRQTPEGGE